jgi:hypothetical protein
MTPMSKANNSGWAAALSILNVMLLLSVLYEPSMLNNGDYFRVTKGFFSDKPWIAAPECSDLNVHITMFRSTMGAVFLVVAYVAKIMGANCLYNKSIAIALIVVFCFGVILAFRQSQKNAFVLTLLTGLALTFNFTFASYYEEAAVLPLLPWLVFAWRRHIDTGKSLLFISLAALLLFCKAQLLALVPLIIFLLLQKGFRHRLGVGNTILAVSFLVSVSCVANILKSTNVEANGYNRYFNGIGWSLQHVADWPADSFSKRSEYFYNNQLILQAGANIVSSGPEQILMGTSYWPTGNKIIKGDGMAAFNNAVGLGLKFGTYFRAFSKPGVAAAYFGSVVKVTLRSNYSLEYIRGEWKFGAPVFLREIHSVLLAHAGWLYSIGMVLVAIFTHGIARVLALSYLVGLPLAVVFGDGFYEFEKHFVTYFMSAPLLYLLCLSPAKFGRRGKVQ